MPKVHPNATVAQAQAHQKPISDCQVQVLTVWKKSLLFNCKGFTVYDGKGSLMFRVDTYFSSNKADIILMDAIGNPLLTIRRKKLTLAENWLVYDEETMANPIFLVKKNVNFLKSKLLAQVISPGYRNGQGKNVVYQIEGLYSRRYCRVYDEKRRIVAEIKVKESVVGGVSFGRDVFSLTLQPGVDPTVMMSLVILLEQMFGSRW
ncbi:hypothetical protein ACHQM5_013080 [Ranunculus cassubicifolius]